MIICGNQEDWAWQRVRNGMVLRSIYRFTDAPGAGEVPGSRRVQLA
ncbi:hypothetical protein Pan189_16150 [Stratiformator vulcanicus]|uniref:Uncharacterized protein n=1 Tax=Stratiformator vulcanicus TaxID=2527980 RepID=A0A517R017_9PLAN|nr:hypothetical protein Pan189_16150 [Stratiformator vulcanicus]